ncbi:uncharacterized protein LAJ45_02095 [Morchella importuna]|uniref:uncharacterized protein n=1 Tax=Morchella importuna TaxID=1174673 RepID=UPI001E8D6D39|nr:uncharacterized protein LAJ45_02095 [Morchella importuna]KAH8154327.1 hypothetical protein LAJ45_02095 [Morchella importuna]
MATPTDPPIHALIIDAGPLIASTSTSSLLTRAQRIYTTPSVIAEIRDPATRSRLETTWLPFLQQRTPKPESVRVVAEFAKKTGDFPALSVTDVQLLALTYELECEGNGGDWRLRRTPGQREVNGPVPGRGGKEEGVEEKEESVQEKEKEGEEEEATADSKETEATDAPQAGEAGKPKRKSKKARMAAKKRAERQEAGEGSETAEKTAIEGETRAQAQAEAQAQAQAQAEGEQAVPAEGKKRNKHKARKGTPAQDGAAAAEAGREEVKEAAEETAGEAAAKLEAPAAEAKEESNEAPASEAPKPDTASAAAAPQETPQEPTATSTLPTPPSTDDDSASDSDSDSGWITATNLHSYKHSDAHTPVHSTPTKKQWPLAAALATTDYAMQNVLLQMNLHLVSPHGLHRIRTIKTWVLRCHACFKLCRDMSKQFCPTCGGATLLKTSCSTDSQGGFQVHLKRNMQWNNRGAVYSIPKTQHGSASGKGVKKNLVLREDQVEYQREVRVRARQKERDLLDPDYLPGILTGERRDAGGPMPKIGYGRKNPNERQGGRNKH